MLNRATFGRVWLPPEPRGIGAGLTLAWCQLTFFARIAEGLSDGLSWIVMASFDFSSSESQLGFESHSVDDSEVVELPGPVLPFHIQIANMSTWRTSSAEV